MIQKSIAVILVYALVGTMFPVLAADLVNPKLLPQRVGNQVGGSRLFAPPQQPTSPAPAAAQTSRSGELTTGGKIMKWVGIGLMAEGTADVIVGATAYKDSRGCASSNGFALCFTMDNSIERAIWYGAGGLSIVSGLVLFLVGRTRRK